MKNLMLILVIIALVSASCSKKSNENAIENKTVATTQDTTKLYACPMHPEITGEKGATCSECGMELTEPVATTDNK